LKWNLESGIWNLESGRIVQFEIWNLEFAIWKRMKKVRSSSYRLVSLWLKEIIVRR